MASNIRTVIEITDTHIKFLQAKKGKGKLLIVAFDASPIEGKLDGEIEEIILQMVQSHTIDPETFTLVLPRRLASVKRLRLPSITDKEIKKMLPIQIGHMMPHVIEDLIYGYEILEKEDAGYVKLIVYIVHKDVTQKYFNLFQRTKIAPSKFILSSLGIVEWFNFQRSQLDIQASFPILLLNLDLLHTELCFIQHHRLLFSRNIHQGLKDLRSDTFINFFDQIELSLKLYRKERFGDEIGKIFVVSSLKEMTELAGTLEKRFHLPIEFISPVDNVFSSGVPIVNQIKEHPGLSLSVCLGLGASDSKSLVNLIAKHIRDEKIAHGKQKQLYQFVGLTFLALFLTVCIVGLDLAFKMTTLNKTNERISEMNADTTTAEAKINLVKNVEEHFSRRIFVPALMAKLYQATPEDITFRSFNINQTGDVVIGGYAQSGTSVNLFQSRLVASPDFSDVSLQFTTKRKLFNQDVIEFKIQLKLKRSQ
ncbi:MAG: PilN domain-containing protein [Candidatus Omnitrophica bacterium]|nr:PilN domain-containing protein [Candidatus Omnitrophota bacterium]